MGKPLHLHPDRLFPTEPAVRALARQLHQQVAALPIISPHGHTDPGWFATNAPFAGATQLLLLPDHYLLRMLYSQGISLERLGLPPGDAGNPRAAWKIFAEHYYLFRATPSRMWLDWVFSVVFGLQVRLEASTADLYFDSINAQLATQACRPRTLFERFNIEVLATTESPTDPLLQHQAIRASDWRGRVITAFRPDPVIDPEFEGFHDQLRQLAALTG
jgi:glucuronate isomerase